MRNSYIVLAHAVEPEYDCFIPVHAFTKEDAIRDIDEDLTIVDCIEQGTALEVRTQQLEDVCTCVLMSQLEDLYYWTNYTIGTFCEYLDLTREIENERNYIDAILKADNWHYFLEDLVRCKNELTNKIRYREELKTELGLDKEELMIDLRSDREF